MLTRQQVNFFDKNGYLFFPSLFSKSELATIKRETRVVLKRRGPEVVLEKDNESIRLIYGTHYFNNVYKCLSQHPRVIAPAEQLLDTRVYIHQSRLNPKAAFEGNTWEWHQDFAVWRDRDGIMEPRALMIAIYIDDVNETNAPLLVIPGSHKLGLIHGATDNKDSDGYSIFRISSNKLTTVANKYGIKAQLGSAGSVLICHSNIIHGSSNNITPWPRTIFYINVAASNNPPTKFDRAEYHCTRNWNPIEKEADDCLQTIK